MDCMEGMKQFPDKYFDLAVVDPPYGGGAKDDEPGILRGGALWEQSKNGRFGGRFRQYHFSNDDPRREDGRDVGEEIQSRGYL